MDKDVKEAMDYEDKVTKKFRKQFSLQIKYDKKHHNLNSTNFSGDDKNNLMDYATIFSKYKKQVSKYFWANIVDKLNIETGNAYKQDVYDENMDQGYNHKAFIKKHQAYFKPECIYPIVDDIDWYPDPLTHKQVWLTLNGKDDDYDIRAYDTFCGERIL